MLNSESFQQILVGGRDEGNNQFAFVGSGTAVRSGLWGGSSPNSNGDCTRYDRHSNNMVNVHCNSADRSLCEAYINQ